MSTWGTEAGSRDGSLRAPDGLRGVIVAETSVSGFVNDPADVVIRGFRMSELVATASFESVVLLLLTGEMPSPGSVRDLDREVIARRATLGPMADEMIRQADPSVSAMDLVLAGAAAVNADPRNRKPGQESSKGAVIDLLAVLPMLIAGTRNGASDGAASPGGSSAVVDALLPGGTGGGSGAARADALRACMVAYCENALNASTFVARIVSSTGAAPGAAMTAAIAALSGPLHGGANAAVIQQVREVERAGGVSAWLDAPAAPARLMGFGHRVFREGDPRAGMLRTVLWRLAAALGRDDFAQLHDDICAEVWRRKSLRPNVDFPAAFILDLLAFTADEMPAIFAVSRLPGWGAHIDEEARLGRLITPSSTYVGW